MIEKKIIQRICKKLLEEQSVIQKLPDNGQMYMEKRMPYICVYRYKKKNSYFTGLLKTQASYLIIKEDIDISLLLKEISNIVSKRLNAFLIIEMWPVQKTPKALFEIFCPENKASATINALEEGFNKVKEIYPNTATKIFHTFDTQPKHLQPIITVDAYKESSNLYIGIAIPALYEDTEVKEQYSLFYRKFYTHFSETIKKAAYEFIRVQTTNPFNHYLMLGKTHIDKITLKADRKLAKISDAMSFLLGTTPVNSTSEWKKFKKSNFIEAPTFMYRLIALDPEKEKRKLFDIPLNKVEDPTIAYILREKRLEIEKKLMMLEERGTDNFRFIGQSLYGKIEDNVVHVAKAILKKYPTAVQPKERRSLKCNEFAEYAQDEIDYYQEKFPDIRLSLETRKDVSGIMVSKSKLLLNDKITVNKIRCDALIQHEIGTHILTYCNGKSQPLKQMYAGFAGYDGLQEGLAVLSEYLVDGLTIDRMRKLAGRVLAAEGMVKGLSFIENFRFLKEAHNFPERIAFNITMRIYRGGGLSKDAVYLAGLLHVMEYLKEGGNLKTLYTGKFNIDHIRLVEELLHRNILKSPIIPRFLERASVKHRLQKVRNGLKVINLLDQ